MVAWKPRGTGNITKGSQPFSTQEMMGGGGGSGSASSAFKSLPLRNIPKASTRRNAGEKDVQRDPEHGGYIKHPEGGSSFMGEPGWHGSTANKLGKIHGESFVQPASNTSKVVGKKFSGNQAAKAPKAAERIKTEKTRETIARINREVLAGRYKTGGKF